jgi:predicted subunit of tRNA(5-methylaminomethyl-2-thiouridylate) methyltransferase
VRARAPHPERLNLKRRSAVLLMVSACLAAPAPVPAQEIVQAVLLDLTVVEVQVIVAGTRADDRVQCLVRSGDRVRVVSDRAVASGFTSGRTTVVSLPLPILDAADREYAVTLVRRDSVLARTAWRPLR